MVQGQCETIYISLSIEYRYLNIKDTTETQLEKQTYVFRHLQHGEHEEDVLLAVLELFVFKVVVDLAISQGELFGQVFEVRSNVGFGLGVPLEAKGSARSVYLLQ